MKRVFQKTFVLLLMTTFRVMSYIPFIGKFGRLMYASCLVGSADGLYFGERYQKAIKEYEHFLHYAHGLEESPILAFQFSRAHEILALMYEKGLGTDKNELKAEEHYLRAGSRGNGAYEHNIATRSWHETHTK